MAEIDKLVRSGFRPTNLPPKSERERERHQAHVEAVLGGQKVSCTLMARDAERRALDALWRTELMTTPKLELTDQMRRLWAEYGLPSQFVRSVLWPWVCGEQSDISLSYGAISVPSTQFKSLIELDVKRTLPFLGFMNDRDKTDKCIVLLEKFASKHSSVGYTQGMSYIAVRLMMELGWDVGKSLVCLEHILIRSPTIACMYSLNLETIETSVGFMLDMVAWDNIPDVWYYLKKMKFQPIDWFFLEWGLTVFVKNFSLKVSAFVFDSLLVQGDVTLFRAAIAVMSLIQQPLLNTNSDPETVRAVLSRAGDLVVDSDVFIKAFHEVYVSPGARRVIDSGVLFFGKHMGLNS